MTRIPGSKLYVPIPSRKCVIELTVDEKGLLRDPDGTVWAMRDATNEVDPTDVCGVYPVSVPDWEVFRDLNDACKPHDFATSSPEYQYFHTFDEATKLLDLIGQTRWWWLRRPFQFITGSRLGRMFWEGKK